MLVYCRLYISIYTVVVVGIIIIIIIIVLFVYNMEGDVVLLGLMDWNAASTATQLIPLPTTTEVCYELLTGGGCIYIYRYIK